MEEKTTVPPQAKPTQPESEGAVPAKDKPRGATPAVKEVVKTADASATEVKVRETERSLDYAIKDGSAYSVMAGVGDTYLAPFAIALGASSTHIGLLASIPQLLASVTQPLAGRLACSIPSRKNLVLNAVMLHALTWPAILAIPLVLPAFKVEALIILAAAYAVFGSIATPAWSSWMADLVPEEKRGEYFGKRNEIIGAVLLAATVVGGLVLGFSQQYDLLLGFAVLFAIACIARLASRHYLGRMAEPTTQEYKRVRVSLREYLSKRNPMKTFSVFVTLMSFSVGVAGPFFVVYMLRDLHFDYFTYTLLIATAIVTKFITNPYWGKLTDKFGTRKVLRVTGVLVSINSLLWLASSDVRYLVFVQAFSGFAWAGFELAAFNYIISTSEREKTASFVANHNRLNGLGVFAGTALGAALATAAETTSIPIIPGLLAVFFISGVMRLAVAAYFLPRLRENRLALDVNEREFFWKATAVYPTQGVMRELQNGWNLGLKGVNLSVDAVAYGTRKGREKMHLLEESLAELAKHESARREEAQKPAKKV